MSGNTRTAENVVRTYDYYTLDQAREIIFKEQQHSRAVRKYRARQAAEQRRKELNAMLIQKVLGIGCVIISVIVPDVSIIGIPMGSWLLLSRQNILYIRKGGR